ncbi:MAG: hypothetical protein DBX91_14180 [Subdoligranulum variabile]|uniref:hypothetical protein n=1 Tax=Gemmiger formicilis TaxID=745368 RepID=UPI000D7B2FCB|nr:MAG: hypothetical protein DBX91_14180 [Subdoligranulum variabile]
MTQYKTQYGTVFAVKEHNGSPAIMCRAEVSETWSLSSMITPFTPGAWTAEELQGQLDNWAATKGWQPVEAPASACLCETCTCTGCHEDCFGHCKGCGHPVDHCNSYQTEGEKRLRAEPASAEPPEIVDEGSGPEDGFPDWVRPMVEAFLQFPFFRELPAFTTAALKNSEPVRHHQGGSLSDGLYDTDSKGIEFTIFRSDNSDKYRKANYTWADFVRRCKAAGLAPEPPHKEDEACEMKTPAPNGDAAATTAASAAPEPSQAAGTTITSESGADANNSPDVLTAPQPTEGCADIAANVPSSLPTFDYSGLDNQTVAALHLAEREFAGGKRMAEIGLRRMADGVAIAHDALCGSCDIMSQLKHGNRGEASFGRWCDSVGLNRKAAERLLNVARLFDQSSPKEEKVLETLGPTLLYEAAKPSAPAELVQAVKDRDITTAKEFRELEAQLKAERAAREKAEKNASENERKITGLEESYRIAHKNEEFTLKNLKTAKAERDEAVKERDDARRQVTEAENRAAGAQKLAEQRGSENTELKAKIRDMENQPRDVAVVQPGEEQIEAWRKEGEDRASAALQDSVRKANQAKADAQRQVAALQDQLAAARPDADACQRTADTLYETTENLRLLLRTQLRQARLTPKDYGNVVAHVLQTADALRDTVRSCAPAGYDFDNEEDDDFE